jgi:large subunit ribosomal protein L24
MQTTKNPKKQRKMLFNAPAHVRHKLMAAPLSPELIAQRGIKSLPVRKGDSVRVVRGDHKGFDGKVSKVDLKHYRVTLEGLTREKVDGTTVFVALHPSKIMIRTLNLDDKVRKALLERKKPVVKKESKAKKSTPKKAAEPAPVAEEPAKSEEAEAAAQTEGGT